MVCIADNHFSTLSSLWAFVVYWLITVFFCCTGVKTVSGIGGGFFPESSPFGRKTRPRAFVRNNVWDKRYQYGYYCATANDTTEPDYSKRLLPSLSELDEPIMRFPFESYYAGHHANDSVFFNPVNNKVTEKTVPMASWQLGYKNTTIRPDNSTNIYSFPENHRDMYYDLHYQNNFIPANATNFFGSTANSLLFKKAMQNRTVWIDLCFKNVSFAEGDDWYRCLPSIMFENRVVINWEVSIVFKNTTLSDVKPPWTDDAPYYA